VSFLRNTFAVLLGLSVVALVITLGIRLNSSWITYDEFSPIANWGRLLESVDGKDYFFVALLISSGIGSMLGGIVAALVVKYAKVAYALLIGFIHLFISMLDVISFPHHPTFYKISILVIIFPFSWIGGKIVEFMYERGRMKKKTSNF